MSDTQSRKAEKPSCFQMRLARVLRFPVQFPGSEVAPCPLCTTPVSPDPAWQLLAVCVVEAALEGVSRGNQTARGSPSGPRRLLPCTCIRKPSTVTQRRPHRLSILGSRRKEPPCKPQPSGS